MLIAIHTVLPTFRRISSPKPFPCFCFCSLNPPMSTSKLIAEYAKSNRSTCKQCSEKIDKGAPRLGLLTRDSRGYDMTKWHHLNCFPPKLGLGDPDGIQGFDSFKSHDQEALNKLMSGCGKSSDEKVDEEEEEENELERKAPTKRKKVKEDAENESEGNSSNKRKLLVPDDKVAQQISFSVSDVRSKYKDATLLPKWKAFQTLVFLERDDGLQDSSKIAAFDFDGCLANTSVKRVGASAWSLMYPSIPDKLQSLYKDGYKLVIFTNESNIERWTKKRQAAVDSKLGRLDNFLKKVKVPIQIYVACGLSNSGGRTEDPFRKPQPGMWRIMEQHFNSSISIDMDQSFYVGDAAGREGDHSDADIKFAQAIGLKFYVPEEYFEQPQLE